MQILNGRQIRVYLGKCFRLFTNEKAWTLFLSSAVIAIIICWVSGDEMFETFYATRNGAFALVCACIWMGIFNSIQSVCRERDIIKREHRTGLRVSSYILAHLVYESFLSFVEALISVIILWILRTPSSNAGVFLPGFIEMFVNLFLIIFSADTMGLLISCLVKNPTQAMTVMPFALILQLVLCGVIFSLSGFAGKLANVTISKWGVRAICTTADVNSMPYADANVYDDYEFVTSHLLETWLMLVIFIAAVAIISIIALSLVDRDKR